MGLDDVGSIIIDLVREGRRLLTNTYQASHVAAKLRPWLVFSSEGLVGWRGIHASSFKSRSTPLTAVLDA